MVENAYRSSEETVPPFLGNGTLTDMPQVSKGYCKIKDNNLISVYFCPLCVIYFYFISTYVIDVNY